MWNERRCDCGTDCTRMGSCDLTDLWQSAAVADGSAIDGEWVVATLLHKMVLSKRVARWSRRLSGGCDVILHNELRSERLAGLAVRHDETNAPWACPCR